VSTLFFCISSLAAVLMLLMGAFVFANADSKKTILPVVLFSVFAFLYIFFAGVREMLLEIANLAISEQPAHAIHIAVQYMGYIHIAGMLSLIAGAYLLGNLWEFSLGYLFTSTRYDRALTGIIYGISTFFALCFIGIAYPIGPYTTVRWEPIDAQIQHYIPPVFFYYMIYIGIGLFGTIFTLVRKMIIAPKEVRTQARWVCGWMSITVFSVFVFSTLMPVLGSMTFARYGRYSFFLTFLGMFIAVTRYQAFNIRTAIHYTLYWIIVSAAVFSPLLGVLFVITPTLNTLFQTRFTVTGLFALLFVSAIIARLHFQWIQPKLNHLFFRRKFQLRDQAIDFAARISQINNTETLIRIVRETFSDLLYASDVNVLLGDHVPEPPLSKLAVPLLIKDTRVGTILIGEKKTLKPFSSDEVRFMNRVSHQIAIFLNNALLFDTLKAKNEELLQVQDSLIHSEREKVKTEQLKTHTEELARGIIHEVKNTHFAISNFVSFILKRSISDPQEIDTILQVIGEQSSKLLLFSKNYLHQELVKSQIYTLRTEHLSVHQLIQDAIKSNHFFIVSQNLTIQTQIATTDHITVDRDKFHLVLSNLINNAAKYQKDNTLVIHGTAQRDHYSLTFSSDLNPEAATTPPMSVENGATTGMGLRISKYILEHHRGALLVTQSEAVFQINLKIPLV
jgi:signal transduction histidine kinase